MTYDRASKLFLYLQPRLISSLSGPLGDETAVDLTAWSGGLRWQRKILAACFWWNSTWDLSSYASLPKWHYTFPAPNLFACSLISYMRGPDTPQITASLPLHQRASDNCRRLSKKTQVREKDWHLFPLPPFHWSRSRKKKAERNWGHRQLEAIWSEFKPQTQQLHVFHE